MICCGVKLEEAVGRYGCPNCEGDSMESEETYMSNVAVQIVDQGQRVNKKNTPKAWFEAWFEVNSVTNGKNRRFFINFTDHEKTMVQAVLWGDDDDQSESFDEFTGYTGELEKLQAIAQQKLNKANLG